MIELYQLINLPKYSDDRGSLCCIEENTQVPFSIARSYYSFNIPDDAKRGGHAHFIQSEMLIAINGKVDVLLDNGQKREIIQLNSPDQGLVINPMIWHELMNFKNNCTLLAYASHVYDSKDYINSYEEFLTLS